MFKKISHSNIDLCLKQQLGPSDNIRFSSTDPFTFQSADAFHRGFIVCYEQLCQNLSCFYHDLKKELQNQQLTDEEREETRLFYTFKFEWTMAGDINHHVISETFTSLNALLKDAKKRFNLNPPLCILEIAPYLEEKNGLILFFPDYEVPYRNCVLV